MNKVTFIVRMLAIVSVVIFLFYPINFFSFVFSYKEISGNSVTDNAVTVLFAYAWIVWLIMAIAWLFQHKLHRFWPISGSITGVISFILIMPLVLPALFVLPAVLLAITFCRYHLAKNHITNCST